MMWRVCCCIIAGLWCSSAFADVTPNSVVVWQHKHRGIVQFTSSSTPGNYLTLYASGVNGSSCFGIVSTNSDSTTHLLTIQQFNSGIGYGGVSVTTTANAGFANAANPQVITGNTTTAGIWSGLPLDNLSGNFYVELDQGDSLQATYATAITAGKVLNVVATCVDY